jgi:hypothetical protein
MNRRNQRLVIAMMALIAMVGAILAVIASAHVVH